MAKETKAELLGPGLVLIKVAAHIPHTMSERRHWLLEVSGKPPLDLMLHRTRRQFLELSFFISHERVPTSNSQPPNITAVGEAVFDLQPWDTIKGYDHYLREAGTTRITLSRNEMYVTVSQEAPMSVIESSGINIWLGRDNAVVGFGLPSLASSLIEILHRAGV